MTTSGPRDAANSEALTEDEIFRQPVASSPPWSSELGAGDSAAGVDPLLAGLQMWNDQGPEAFESFVNDLNSANGVGVHAEAVLHQSMQPAYAPRSTETWSRGNLDQVGQAQRGAAPLSGRNVANYTTPDDQHRITYLNRLGLYSPPPSARRRAPERNFVSPDAIRSVRNAQAHPGLKMMPLSSVLKHPFLPRHAYSRLFPAAPDHGMIPTLLPIINPVQPSGFVSASPMLRAPTLLPEPRQEILMPVNFHHEAPLMSSATDQMEWQLNFTPPNSAAARTHDPPQMEPVSMAMVQRGPHMSSDAERQALAFNNFPTSTTTTSTCDPASMAVEFGSDVERQIIDFNYPSPVSDWSIQAEADLWGALRESTNAGPGMNPDQQQQVPDQQPVQEPSPMEFKSPRFKWSSELNKKFEEVVHSLGGPDRATPKAILLKMANPEITILQVKSHLQKFRLHIHSPKAGTKRQLIITSDQHSEDQTSQLEKDMEEILHQTIEKCKDCTELITKQQAQMRQMLAIQEAQSEVVRLNATTLEAYAAKLNSHGTLRTL